MSLTEWLLATQLQAPSKLVPLDVAFALLTVAVLLPALRALRSRAAWRRAGLRAAVAGAAAVVVLVVCWVLSDLMNLFGVALSPVTRMWLVLAAAALGIAVVGLVQGGRWRRVLAAVLVPAALLVPALGVNVEFAMYPTLGTVVQKDPYPELDLAAVPAAAVPAVGEVRTVDIPGQRSGFDARPAVVYLPPAALVRDPRPLPVVLAFSGQPGAPSDLFTAGQLDKALDAYAAAHQGRAPIVVSVDQLSAPGLNTMCVDSTLGKARTYVTEDVPRWLTAHLPVTTDRHAWGLTGFSQGATCAMQFVTAQPDRFGPVLAVSSELHPIDQNPQHSADRAFGGSLAAWKAAGPMAQMRANGLHGHALWLTAGSSDREFSDNARVLARAARAAGAHATVALAPGSGHDWNTVQWSFRTELPQVADVLFAALR
ncbi:alpha/beta hydrolase [Curtobacterium herbarum]|uniref:Alpha/beta hydrolase-fold protein n=1 Tax=Curtobacterium herbarum TaxID=150122 RepID=A0ABN1ZCP1_9MICO|nr:alpha/beta hydrolase-fold protein [Curtobacterium herbarum]MBM7473791.1 S-formylglutathione hydrolase FrmB [Curtobacterium herbarum]MCS6544877.1 alpha/beta hydrolase-fold protein [Curtobacterium herbarum]